MACTDIDVESIKYELYNGGIRSSSEHIYEEYSRNPLVFSNLVQDGNTLNILGSTGEPFATFQDEQTAYSVMTILENAEVCADFIMGECTEFVDEVSKEVCDDFRYIECPECGEGIDIP